MYYIYIHYEGNEPVYVGMGAGGRAFTSAGRKEGHKEWMTKRLDKGDASFVSFELLGLSKKEATHKEADLIKTLQPRYNQFFTESWKQNNKTRGLKGAAATSVPCTTPLGIFISHSAAAKAHGFNDVASIHYRIKNKHEGFYRG